MQKDEVAIVKIEDIGVDGEGIGKVDGYTLFVKDAIIGDEAEVKVIKAKKNYGYARLMRIITPSEYRVEPKCPYARGCGGCQIQEMSYERQLEFKAKKVRDNLERIGGFDATLLERVTEPMVGMDEPFHYRNKAQFPFGTDKDGQPICGFYAGRTHHIIANTDCALGVEINQEILEQILAFMKEYHVQAYDEKTGRGLLRHVLLRYGFATKEIMVCLVVNGKKIPHVEELVRRLAQIEGMTSITLSPNTKRTNVIMGDSFEVLWGQGYITDSIGGVNYRISPLSFYQVNPVQTEKLYAKALEYADLQGGETVWDLYCGIGTISLFLAREAKMVYGVEVVEQAVEDARENARQNGIENVEFYTGRAEDVLPRYYKKDARTTWDDTGKEIPASVSDARMAGDGDGKERGKAEPRGEVQGVGMAECGDTDGKAHPDVIVVDPPRKGCEESLLETMAQMRPERIVYVSCNPATLARDLKYLCERGYELKKVGAVDQFPMGVHVEVVCLLSKLKFDKHIDVELGWTN